MLINFFNSLKFCLVTSVSLTTTMARRSAPPGSGPSYMAPSYGISGGRRLADPNESWFSAFWREQIANPQYQQGNFSILTSVALFTGGVVALRQWGDVLLLGLEQ